MTLSTRLLASTMGRVFPKYRTLNEWAETYRKVIDARPITCKTKANRNSSLMHILNGLGDRIISSIKPHEVASLVLGKHPPSLHECRSLSERLYRAQGINTMILLGHKHQAMTDMYNDDRGLTRGEWKTLTL